MAMCARRGSVAAVRALHEPKETLEEKTGGMTTGGNRKEWWWLALPASYFAHLGEEWWGGEGFASWHHRAHQWHLACTWERRQCVVLAWSHHRTCSVFAARDHHAAIGAHAIIRRNVLGSGPSRRCHPWCCCRCRILGVTLVLRALATA
jgi:hypothetical protein